MIFFRKIQLSRSQDCLRFAEKGLGYVVQHRQSETRPAYELLQLCPLHTAVCQTKALSGGFVTQTQADRGCPEIRADGDPPGDKTLSSAH